MDLGEAKQHERDGREATGRWQSELQQRLIAEVEARNGHLPDSWQDVMLNATERTASGTGIRGPEGPGGPDPVNPIDNATEQKLKASGAASPESAEAALAEVARIEARHGSEAVVVTPGTYAGKGPTKDGAGPKVVSDDLPSIGQVVGREWSVESNDGVEVTTTVTGVSTDDYVGLRSRSSRARGADRDPRHRGRDPEVLDWDADWHQGRAREHRQKERARLKDMNRSRGVILKAIYGLQAGHHGSAAHSHEVSASESRQGARDGRADQLQARQRSAPQFDGRGL